MKDELIAALKKVPLFTGLTDEDLASLTQDAEEKTYAEGQDIITQGDAGGPFFLILEGRAKVMIDGQERRAVGPGQYFGEYSLIDGEPRSATVRAESDVRGVAIPSWNFLSILEENFSIARKFMANMSRRLRAIERGD